MNAIVGHRRSCECNLLSPCLLIFIFLCHLDCQCQLFGCFKGFFIFGNASVELVLVERG